MVSHGSFFLPEKQENQFLIPIILRLKGANFGRSCTEVKGSYLKTALS